MFDIGWSEMAVIVLVALIVIGPKDLPRLAREVGRWSGKARAMAREFQRNMDDMAREADLQDIKAQVDKVSRTSLTDTIRDTIDPDRSIERATRIEDPFSPPPPPPYVPPAPEAVATPTDPVVAAPAVIAPAPEAIAEIERALVHATPEHASVPIAGAPIKTDQAG